MVYSPPKSVFTPVTWLPFKNSTTLQNGSGSPLSISVTFPFKVPDPTCANNGRAPKQSAQKRKR